MPNMSNLPREFQEQYRNVLDFTNEDNRKVFISTDFNQIVPGWHSMMTPLQWVMSSIDRKPENASMLKEMLKTFISVGIKPTFYTTDFEKMNKELFLFLLQNNLADPSDRTFLNSEPTRANISLIEILRDGALASKAIYSALLEFIFEREVAHVQASKEQAREKLPPEMFSGQGPLANIIGDYASKTGKEVFEKYFSEAHPDEFYEQLLDTVRSNRKQKEKHESDALSATPTTHFDQKRRADAEPAGSAAEAMNRHKEEEDRKKRGERPPDCR